jgi:TPR repeat protein
VKWYRKAADQGNAIAQHNLGYRYYTGDGVTQNHTEAVKWYRKAADQGFAIDQAQLGFLYANGQGVPQNYGEAVKWYRKAADQGDANGQMGLGFMYSYGRGVPQNHIQAHMWYNLAASRYDTAQLRDVAIKSRDRLASNMNSALRSRRPKDWRRNAYKTITHSAVLIDHKSLAVTRGEHPRRLQRNVKSRHQERVSLLVKTAI